MLSHRVRARQLMWLTPLSSCSPSKNGLPDSLVMRHQPATEHESLLCYSGSQPSFLSDDIDKFPRLVATRIHAITGWPSLLPASFTHTPKNMGLTCSVQIPDGTGTAPSLCDLGSAFTPRVHRLRAKDWLAPTPDPSPFGLSVLNKTSRRTSILRLLVVTTRLTAVHFTLTLSHHARPRPP